MIVMDITERYAVGPQIIGKHYFSSQHFTSRLFLPEDTQAGNHRWLIHNGYKSGVTNKTRTFGIFECVLGHPSQKGSRRGPVKVWIICDNVEDVIQAALIHAHQIALALDNGSYTGPNKVRIPTRNTEER